MPMQDIHQSPRYASFMQRIGWLVEEIDGTYIFIKRFPFIEAVIKIQRPEKLPELNKLHALMRRYHASKIFVEPSVHFSLKPHEHPSLNEPFLPTKTIQIDLTESEIIIFKRFTEAKQRAVRRAQKAGVIIESQQNIDAFIKLKSHAAGFLGFLTTTTLKPLWQAFTPENVSVLLAHYHEQIVAGVLLLWHNHTAYYWMAGANQIGKQQFAPTLLVWEALKRAKHNGCTVFDFEGIYDERYPKLNKNWLGFTKFKQGFGGQEIHFSKPFMIK